MEKIDIILTVFEEMFPSAKCELRHENEFELLMAVLLSAQTTDASVNKLTKKLFEKYKKPEDFIKVPLHELEADIKSIGLYRNKARNIKKLCETLIDKYQGEILNDQKMLESLAGVGRKTANVVRSVWFNEPRIAVDTHVERVSKRLKLAYLKDTPLEVEKKLMEKIPKSLWSDTHHKMIFFGRYHCTSRNPNCDECKLINLCRYKK